MSDEPTTGEVKKITTDSAIATLTTVEGQPTRKTYVVTSTEGLFKNGKRLNKGDEVELDDNTAHNFLELGNIEAKQ